MSRAASLLDALRESGDFRPLIATIPYARYLGLHVDVIDRDPITRLHGDGQLVGNPVLPALHGGTVGALLESAAIFKLIWEGTSLVVPKTINITIDYLRSARVVDTYARASVTKQGRRVVNVRMWAWQAEESKPIAAAHAHFLVKTDAP